jgi:hypothetical protein
LKWSATKLHYDVEVYVLVVVAQYAANTGDVRPWDGRMLRFPLVWNTAAALGNDFDTPLNRVSPCLIGGELSSICIRDD